MNYPTIIDISYCQQLINWAILKVLGIGVIIRMGQSVYEDTLFRTHYENAVKYGVPFAVYWFFQPDLSASLQVQAFLKIWNSLPVKPSRIFLDVENISYRDANGKLINIVPPSVEQHSYWLDLWLTTVEKATGITPGVYTRADYWDAWVNKSEKWSHFFLWIASWTLYSANIRMPRDWAEWIIWQNEGGTGRQDGVTGPVDKNKFNGDQAQMVAFLGDPTQTTENTLINTYKSDVNS